MRLVSYTYGGRPSWGAVRDDVVRDMPSSGHPATLLEFIQAGPGAWAEARAHVDGGGGDLLELSRVELAAPIPRPAKNVFCLGANYPAHAAEAGHPPPEAPIYFTKPPTAVTGHGASIPSDADLTRQLDYEGELGVVIGVGGRNIPASEALSHVFGYTIINDVSAREVQHGRPERQWFLGKSFDGFCPMGPALVTADDLPDPQSLDLEVRVNGEVRQSASTSTMTFSVARIIEDLSRYLTLEPGDIISTGTPSGVGAAMSPPRFLSPGDVVEVEVSGIGTLRNVVVDDGRAGGAS